MIAGTYWRWVHAMQCIAGRYKSHLILNKRKPQWLEQAKYTQVATAQGWINDSWAIITGTDFNWQETKGGIAVLEQEKNLLKVCQPTCESDTSLLFPYMSF